MWTIVWAKKTALNDRVEVSMMACVTSGIMAIGEMFQITEMQAAVKPTAFSKDSACSTGKVRPQ
jgi:hypothetical protein